jgi:23S rRNA maturation-related 3'-5' exoribonuclease YhaM
MGDSTGEKLEYEEDSRFSQNTADMINAESIKARKIIEQHRIEDQTRQSAAQERDYRQRMLSGMEFALKDPAVIAAQKEMIGKAMEEWLQDPTFKEHILRSTRGLDDTPQG